MHIVLSLLLLPFIVTHTSPADADAPDWSRMLEPVEVTWPAPHEEVVWHTDLRAALDRAVDSDRPVFLTVRCLPCKQCSDFDRDVLEGGPALDPLLKRFETVRLTDAAELDLVLLDVEGFQDLDLSWWGWFLSPSGETYGAFGGRDHVSDSTRISVPALANALRRVLDHHADPRRTVWKLDGRKPDLTQPFRGPRDLEGFASWRKSLPEEEASTCVHCHQVADVLRQPALDAGRFDKERGLDVWPLPENVGLTVDRDHGLRVTTVEKNSPAARAGLRDGDELAAVAGRRVFSQTDVRAALHRTANPSGALELVALRDGEVVEARLELAEGWRATDLTWRMSVSQGNVGAHPGFAWPHKGPAQAALKKGGMSIRPWFGRNAEASVAWQAGLRQHHTIVAVGGESPDLAGRGFMVWFRRHYDRGDPVELTCREGDATIEISYLLPD
jgi:hypothetical protein